MPFVDSRCEVMLKNCYYCCFERQSIYMGQNIKHRFNKTEQSFQVHLNE